MSKRFVFSFIVILLLVVFPHSARAEITYKVLKASTAPTLDGTISAGEWDNARIIEMSAPMPEGWSTGTETIHTTWYFMWDDNYLHVAGRMYDDTRDFLQSSPGPYNGQDTIQICFNPNNDPAHAFAEGSGVAGIYDLVAQTSDAYGPDVYRHGLANNTVPGALSSGTVETDGWTYEGSIPWSELMVGEDTGYTPSAGDVHGLGLIIVSKKSGALTLITDFGNGHNTIGTSTTWNLMALIEDLGGAYGPNPRNNAESVEHDTVLSWQPGENAVSHDLYFSDDFNDVNEGMRLAGDIDGNKIVDLSDVEALGSQIAGPPAGPYPADLDDDNDVDLIDYAIFAEDYLQECNDPAFVGTFIDNQYDTDTLEPNKTYYWCVDERAPSDTTYGSIWRFTTSPSLPTGTIIVDPNNSARMIYHATYENGRLKPVCFAGPGDPEDFFYNNTAANLSLLTSRPARCTYITAVLQDFGGGNPGTGAALDTKLDEWEGYITTLENAGVITVFFFFDDSQGLTGNWQELVDKCVAKFKHHKLLIWSVAEEYGEALSTAQVSQVAARIKSQDNHCHVVGVHQNSGNSFDFAGDSNLDMFLMQLNYSTPGDLHNQVKNSNVNGTKILNMAEASDHAKQTRTAVRQWNWASIMGGASAVQVLWMGRASDPADWNTQDKYNDCARLMDFMESTNLNVTTCRDDLARGNTDYVLADPGNVYILYGDAGTSLGVNIQAGAYNVKWFDPIDGDWVDEGSQVLTAGDKTFTKPGAIGAEAALYLEFNPWTSYGVETENYDTQVGSGWSLQTSTSGYSGSGYMQATASGTLEYDISFPAAGTYYCYIRNWASTSENNGCHLEFDSVRLSEMYDREAVYATKQSIWNWATQWQLGESSHIGPLDIVVDSAGNHTLGIVTRDLGFKIDRIIIVDHKIGGQDYTGTTAPAFLDELDTIPNGYN